MKENFNPQNRNEGDNLNYDAPKNEILPMTEEKGYIKQNNSESIENIREVLRKLKARMNEKYSVTNYEKKKEEFEKLKNRFKDQITLIDDIENLNNFLQDSEAHVNTYSFPLEKEQELNEKTSIFDKFANSSEYEDFERMFHLEYELNNWENDKNNYLAIEKNTKELEN